MTLSTEHMLITSLFLMGALMWVQSRIHRKERALLHELILHARFRARGSAKHCEELQLELCDAELKLQARYSAYRGQMSPRTTTTTDRKQNDDT